MDQSELAYEPLDIAKFCKTSNIHCIESLAIRCGNSDGGEDETSRRSSYRIVRNCSCDSECYESFHGSGGLLFEKIPSYKPHNGIGVVRGAFSCG